MKNHRFFNCINWKLLYKKGIVPPYTPVVKSDGDTSNFGNYESSDEYLVPIVDEKNDPFLSW